MPILPFHLRDGYTAAQSGEHFAEGRPGSRSGPGIRTQLFFHPPTAPVPHSFARSQRQRGVRGPRPLQEPRGGRAPRDYQHPFWGGRGLGGHTIKEEHLRTVASSHPGAPTNTHLADPPPPQPSHPTGSQTGTASYLLGSPWAESGLPSLPVAMATTGLTFWSPPLGCLLNNQPMVSSVSLA